MNEWTSGYVAELDYTHGFYRELTPGFLQLALLFRGVAPPPAASYLELGFGQGLSLNIHAAACSGEFWGTDFNPNQAAHARALAQTAGSGAQLFDLSFEELAQRNDLPEFDYICLHGIWSWISDANREVIVDLIRRRLKVGGAVYVSYNTLPGWAAAMPLRHLLTLHAEAAGSESQGLVGRINSALEFAKKLVDANAVYFAANPGVTARLQKIAEQNRNYLAHEYFNRDWAPMHFAELAERMERAKLTFAASANPLDHVEMINVPPAGQEILKNISHPVLRESVLDYMVNQQFRRDIFVKGLRRLPLIEHIERLRDVRLVLTARVEDIEMKVKGVLGEAALQKEIYEPLVAGLAERNYAPKTLEEIKTQPALASLSGGQLLQALTILVGGGHVHPAQSESEVKTARERCRRLNRALIDQARSSSNVQHLASPVLGGGVQVTRIQQLFLMHLAAGKKLPSEWVQPIWDLLSRQGHRLLKDGKAVDSPAENLAEIERQAKEFVDKRLPILRVMEVAP